MVTFLDIQTDVRRNVIDLPSAVSAAVPGFINQALDVIQDHNFRVMETQVDFVTTVGTRVLGARPSNFKEFRGEPWFTDFIDGRVRPMTTGSSHEGTLRAEDADDVGWPRVLVEGMPSDAGVANWEVFPLPDGLSDYVDGEYRVSVPYYRTIPALSADGDSNWFTNNARKFLEWYATALAFSVDWDEARQGVWLQMAEAERRRVVKRDKMSQLLGMRTVVPHRFGARSPFIRD